MRVGMIALQHESNTFLPSVTTIDDFRRDSLLTGEAIRSAYGEAHHELGGFFAGLDEQNIEAVPLLAALSLPSGTITAATVEQLVGMMHAGLDAAGTLDGLLVAPHGAGVSESHRDLDGYWLGELRRRLGAKFPMVCTLDPHANVSPRMIAACDATIAYRSNPHLDQRQVGLQAARIMGRTLHGEIRPVQALCAPGVAISIDRQHSTEPPCTGLYALADEILREPGILSNSVILGFPYADVEEMGSSFIVVADGNRAQAQTAADRLGRYLVDHRQEFSCGLATVDEALDEVENGTTTVCLLDVGDNVGGGSPGDSVTLANAIHKRQLDRALVVLADAGASAAERRAGVGNEVELAMGGHIDPHQGPPLVARVRVESLHDGKFEEPEVRHGGRIAFDMGPTAVVRTEHGLTLILTTHRVPPFSLRQITSVGIDPTKFKMIVAKGVNAPVAAYAPVCPRLIRVNTPGVTAADMKQFKYLHRGKPLYPMEDLAT